MLTFAPPSHNARINKSGSRPDSAALCFFKTDLFKEYAHEAHFSAKQSRAGSSSRFPSSYVDSRWTQYIECTPGAWPQEAFCLIHKAKAGALL